MIDSLLNKSLVKGSLDFSIHARANCRMNNGGKALLGMEFYNKDGVIEVFNWDKVIEDTSSED